MINTVFGQKIVIDTNGLFLNSRQISKQSPPDSIVSILGSPDRTFALYNTIWTYDDLGLLIYINPNNSTLVEITVTFKKGTYDFSPREIFTGDCILYGFHLKKKTASKRLKKIKDLNIEEPFTQFYQAKTSNLILCFLYLESVASLDLFSVSFQ